MSAGDDMIQTLTRGTMPSITIGATASLRGRLLSSALPAGAQYQSECGAEILFMAFIRLLHFAHFHAFSPL